MYIHFKKRDVGTNTVIIYFTHFQPKKEKTKGREKKDNTKRKEKKAAAPSRMMVCTHRDYL